MSTKTETAPSPDQPDPPSSKADSKIEVAEKIVGMIRTLTVPAVAVFLIFAFFEPLSRVASILPDKFKEASKVSYGGFLLEVQRTAERRGNPELAEKIGDLSEPSLRYLLNASENKRFIPSYSPQEDGTKHYYLPDQRELDAINELETKKLYTCDMPIKAWAQNFLTIMRPIEDRGSRRYVLKEGVNAPSSLNNGCEPSTTGESAVGLIISVVTREIAEAREKGEADEKESKQPKE